MHIRNKVDICKKNIYNLKYSLKGEYFMLLSPEYLFEKNCKGKTLEELEIEKENTLQSINLGNLCTSSTQCYWYNFKPYIHFQKLL